MLKLIFHKLKLPEIFIKTKFLSAIGLVVFGSFLLTELAFAANDKKVEPPKKALYEVHQKLESMKKALDSSQEAHKDAADELKNSEVAISLANKKLYEFNVLQQKNNSKLSKLNTDSKSISQQLAQQQQLLSNQLYLQYTHSQQSYLQIIMQSGLPSEMARDLHYFSYIAKKRAELIQKMQSNLSKLNALNEQTTEALQAVNTLKQLQVAQRQALEQQKLVKAKIVQTLAEKIAQQRGEIKKLSRDEKNLSDLVERLAKLALAKPKPAKTVQIGKKTPLNTEDDTQKSKEMIANNEILPSQEFGNISFAALKGKLRLPVRGNVMNRFGSAREDSGISWKGLFIQANEGAEVKSIANGRVVFADWMRGFGNLIIVDHGSGYMSLYGNNQAILKSVGTNVSSGDVIASVGNSGGNDTNGLYYELRKQSRPFDPLSWSNLN